MWNFWSYQEMVKGVNQSSQYSNFWFILNKNKLVCFKDDPNISGKLKNIKTNVFFLLKVNLTSACKFPLFTILSTAANVYSSEICIVEFSGRV